MYIQSPLLYFFIRRNAPKVMPLHYDEWQWVQFFFFPHGGIHWQTFAFPCQMPFCQIGPLLTSVAWQQYGMRYWWEGSTSTAIPPTSASDAMSQRNKTGGITSRAALVKYIVNILIFNVFLKEETRRTKTKNEWDILPCFWVGYAYLNHSAGWSLILSTRDKIKLLSPFLTWLSPVLKSVIAI